MSSDKVEPEQAQTVAEKAEAESIPIEPVTSISAMKDDENEDEQAPTVEEELEEAKRFFALKRWSEAADAYAQVLELL